jgi:hypothetical protein
MPTECMPKRFEFEAVARRAVVACFDGGDITSNAGALLLGQVDRGLGLMRRFAACFTDRRDPRLCDVVPGSDTAAVLPSAKSERRLRTTVSSSRRSSRQRSHGWCGAEGARRRAPWKLSGRITMPCRCYV